VLGKFPLTLDHANSDQGAPLDPPGIEPVVQNLKAGKIEEANDLLQLAFESLESRLVNRPSQEPDSSVEVN